MHEFSSPKPISAKISLHGGRLSIVAGDRADTVVDVAPADPAAAGDIRAAEHTKVEFAAGQLSVKVPEPNWATSIITRPPAVDVRIELPAGSDVQAEVVKAEIRSEGRLGEVRLDTVSGEVLLDQIRTLHASTVSGDITVAQTSGYVDVNTVHGLLRLHTVQGSAVVNGVSGDVWVGSAGSDLHINTVSGNIFVDDLGSGMSAKTSSGTIRIARLTRGEVELATGSGGLEVGIGETSTAWVDAKSVSGSVRYPQPAQETPPQRNDMVNIRARTRSGDIVIHRAAPSVEPSA